MLSTTRSIFFARHTWPTDRMSVNAISGFVGVSMKTIRVCFWIARSTFRTSELSTYANSNPKSAQTWLNKRGVPP